MIYELATDGRMIPSDGINTRYYISGDKIKGKAVIFGNWIYAKWYNHDSDTGFITDTYPLTQLSVHDKIQAIEGVWVPVAVVSEVIDSLGIENPTAADILESADWWIDPASVD